MSYKPVYVPRTKRKRPVEDETPPECIPASQVLSRIQRPEDFMDDRDHNEWGGPTRVKAEFEETTRKDKQDDHLSIRSMNVGEKLLRKLGWRDHNQDATATQPTSLTAYLPIDSSNGNNKDARAVLNIGSKQLRKITLQQSRVVIPQPWKGRWGLGYQSELRGLAPGREGSSNHQYRLSNVVVHSSGVMENAKPPDNVEYEGNTLQDFVGTHSSAGFALREDEDDAYDNSMTNEKSFHSTVLGVASQRIKDRNQASLKMEAYQHEDSDSEQEGVKKPTGDFKTTLSSWAIGGDSTALHQHNVGTIEGFVLGANAATKPKLYRGPDVPKEWQIRPHQFGPNEHPSILKAIAHATKLVVAQERRAKKMSEVLEAATLKRRSVFAGIGEQMKNRFALAGSSTNEPEPEAPLAHSIKRTVTKFVPDPLLCKRMDVSAPTQQPVAAIVVQRRDETFFRNEVMGAVAKETKKRAAETTALLNSGNDSGQDDDEPQRPALDVYKSIFDPDIPVDADHRENTRSTDGTNESDGAPTGRESPLRATTTSLAVSAKPVMATSALVELPDSDHDQLSFEKRRKRENREKSSKKKSKKHRKKKHHKRDSR